MTHLLHECASPPPATTLLAMPEALSAGPWRSQPAVCGWERRPDWQPGDLETRDVSPSPGCAAVRLFYLGKGTASAGFSFPPLR